jgi:hypothetical protein
MLRNYTPSPPSVSVTRSGTALAFSSSTAVPWLRRLVAGLSPQSPEFAPGSIHVAFLVDRVALGQVCLRVLHFSPVSIIPPSFSILIFHRGDEQYVR